MEQERKNRSRLWDSLEMHVTLRGLILNLAVGIVCILISREQILKWIMAVVLLPFVIFYVVRIAGILRKSGSYRFYKTKLDKPYQNYFAKAMYFNVELEEEDGEKHLAETHAIFACHGIIGPLVENYVNRTVTVAYNPATGMVVVIG